MSQAAVSRPLHSQFPWSSSFFLYSAQLMCLFFQTCTCSPFREAFSDWLVLWWFNWNLWVKEKMVPAWGHGSVVDRWTSRWFVGLPIWRYVGYIIIYVIVISRALCLESVLYKEKGPSFRQFSGSTSPLNLTPLCGVQNAQGPFEASWPLLPPPRAHLPIFLLISFFSIVSTTIQEMKMWAPLFKSIKNFKTATAEH